VVCCVCYGAGIVLGLSVRKDWIERSGLSVVCCVCYGAGIVLGLSVRKDWIERSGLLI